MNSQIHPSPPPTRLAILRTMGNLHTEPLRYDLESLYTLILQLAPDLLCADITSKAWESGDLSTATIELRKVLAPAIALTDTILVPISPVMRRFSDFQAPAGPRRWLSQRFDGLLRWGQKRANTPEVVHGPAFETFCHTVCALEKMTWTKTERDSHQAHAEALAANILEAIQRDPGGRVLVVVQCQWNHTLEPLLLGSGSPWLGLVDYREL